MKTVIAALFVLLLLSSMRSGPAHVYTATIGPLTDTIIPDYNNDLTFLDNGKEMQESPPRWEYSFSGDKVDVTENNGNYTVRCASHKMERHALLMIYLNKKVVFKKVFPIPVMKEALKKRVESL
jgi:hypothetical protein